MGNGCSTICSFDTEDDGRDLHSASNRFLREDIPSTTNVNTIMDDLLYADNDLHNEIFRVLIRPQQNADHGRRGKEIIIMYRYAPKDFMLTDSYKSNSQYLRNDFLISHKVFARNRADGNQLGLFPNWKKQNQEVYISSPYRPTGSNIAQILDLRAQYYEKIRAHIKDFIKDKYVYILFRPNSCHPYKDLPDLDSLRSLSLSSVAPLPPKTSSADAKQSIIDWLHKYVWFIPNKEYSN